MHMVQSLTSYSGQYRRSDLLWPRNNALSECSSCVYYLMLYSLENLYQSRPTARCCNTNPLPNQPYFILSIPLFTPTHPHQQTLPPPYTLISLSFILSLSLSLSLSHTHTHTHTLQILFFPRFSLQTSEYIAITPEQSPKQHCK